MGLWQSWIELAVRWLHLTAGIAWIGSSFYFMWLDSHLRKDAGTPEGVAGELWSVHSGGFYRQMKFTVAPPQVPQDLHWFKWEAYTTFFSGLLLMGLVFYLQAGTRMALDGAAGLSPPVLIALGLGALAAAWVVYDLLCRSPLGQHDGLFGAVWLIVMTAGCALLGEVMTARAAVMHVGGMAGTVMAANVFFVIIPNQRRMVDQLLAGAAPDPRLGLMAKQRSVHNNYMTLPVLFIMISNHYPAVYGGPYPWAVVAGLALAGMLVRHFFNLRHRGRIAPQWLVAGAILFAATAALTMLGRPEIRVAEGAGSYASIRPVIDKHCISCHAQRPTHPDFPQAPNGAMFDTAEGLKRAVPGMWERVIETRTMPLGDATHMSDDERAAIAAWLKAGAPVTP